MHSWNCILKCSLWVFLATQSHLPPLLLPSNILKSLTLAIQREHWGLCLLTRENITCFASSMWSLEESDLITFIFCKILVTYNYFVQPIWLYNFILLNIFKTLSMWVGDEILVGTPGIWFNFVSPCECRSASTCINRHLHQCINVLQIFSNSMLWFYMTRECCTWTTPATSKKTNKKKLTILKKGFVFH